MMGDDDYVSRQMGPTWRTDQQPRRPITVQQHLALKRRTARLFESMRIDPDDLLFQSDRRCGLPTLARYGVIAIACFVMAGMGIAAFWIFAP